MASGWHRVDDDWVDHPKTVRLEELLNDPNAGAYVSRLWAWTSRFRVRGRFADDVVRHLETLCRWRGEPRKLFSALLAAGFVDELSSGQYEVHDWWDKQGQLVEKAEKESARKRKYRGSLSRGRPAGQGADGDAHVPRDGAGTRRTRRDETDETLLLPAAVVAEVWERLQQQRDERACHREEARPDGFAAWLAEALPDCPADDPQGALVFAYGLYLNDDDFRPKYWPTRVFMHPDVWKSRVPTKRGAA